MRISVWTVAQTVKHLSTMWETWVRSLGWEDSLEKEMATHSSTLALKIPWTEELGAGYYPCVAKSWARLSDFTFMRIGTCRIFPHFHFSSRAQSCPTLCDPMDCSTPDVPVHHQLLEPAQTSVHTVSDAVQPSYPLSSPSTPNFNLSQHQHLF